MGLEEKTAASLCLQRIPGDSADNRPVVRQLSDTYAILSLLIPTGVSGLFPPPGFQTERSDSAQGAQRTTGKGPQNPSSASHELCDFEL